MENQSHGLIDNWLRNIQDIHKRNAAQFEDIEDPNKQLDLLCELNVIEQVERLKRTTIVTDAWQRQQPLTVHGWIYGIHDGLLKDLNATFEGPDN